MPLLKCSVDPLPRWSDLDSIEIIRMKKGESGTFQRQSLKEKFFLGDGECEINVDGKSGEAKAGDFFDLNVGAETFRIEYAESDSVIIRIAGRWGNETGSCGVFSMNKCNTPKNAGDPADYPRTTEFDNHYHDCDEYWIIFKGSGLAVSEGINYTLNPDTILATRMGDHHDLPKVFEEIHAAWFESTLKGKKRRGHLWNHTHGKPEIHD
jgi:mannose-6-phosphate isomerase-like protein (cupin superfamily)